MGKPIKLDIKPDFDFTLIGLVTSEQLYRVSWLINELLNIHLKETPPLQVYHTKRQIVQEFPKFCFCSDSSLCFYLIGNKSQQGFLIEEQKQVDYWIKVEGLLFESNDLTDKLKGLKNINLAFEVKPGSLKSKSRLLFSEEND